MPNWIKLVMKDDGVDTMTPTVVDALNSQYISTLLYCFVQSSSEGKWQVMLTL